MSTEQDITAYATEVARFAERRGHESLGYPCVFVFVSLPIVDGSQKVSIVSNVHSSMTIDVLRQAVADYDRAVAEGSVDVEKTGSMQ